jgi:hypothetical protein
VAWVELGAEMKKWIGAAVAAVAMLVLVAPPAGAGLDAAPLTVRKVPVGPVPAGTQFVVTISCDKPIISTGNGSVSSTQLVFDAQGNPVGPDTVEFSDFGTCTVTETQTGGAASVIYECEGSFTPGGLGSNGGGARFGLGNGPPREVCETSGPQSEPITMHIVSPAQDATVTITNTFEAVPAPPPPPEPVPAEAVTAPARFTG